MLVQFAKIQNLDLHFIEIHTIWEVGQMLNNPKYPRSINPEMEQLNKVVKFSFKEFAKRFKQRKLTI